MAALQKKVVEVDGIHTTYYDSEEADKPVLLLLHGFTANKEVWLWFAQPFLSAYRVLIPDMAGHGETGYVATVAYDIPSQAKRMADFSKAVGAAPFHVAGNSMGGYIATMLALNHPEQVLSVIAIDPAGVESPEPSDLQKSIYAGKNPFEVNSDAEFREFHVMTMAKPPEIPESVMTMMSQYYQAERAHFMQIFGEFAASDKLEPRLSEIKQPFLLIWGALDRLIHVSSVPVWLAGVGHAQSEVFEDLGHMPMLEDPARCAARVQAFLAEL